MVNKVYIGKCLLKFIQVTILWWNSSSYCLARSCFQTWPYMKSTYPQLVNDLPQWHAPFTPEHYPAFYWWYPNLFLSFGLSFDPLRAFIVGVCIAPVTSTGEDITGPYVACCFKVEHFCMKKTYEHAKILSYTTQFYFVKSAGIREFYKGLNELEICMNKVV